MSNKFDGELISVTPSSLEKGEPITLVVEYEISTSFWEGISSWISQIVVTLSDGNSKTLTNTTWFISSDTLEQEFSFDSFMGNEDITASIVVNCYEDYSYSGGEEVINEDVTIKSSSSSSDDETEDEDSESSTNWMIPVAIGGGAGLLLLAYVLSSKKP